MNIVIIDYGAGNTQSVKFSLERLGVNAILSSDSETIRSADGVIFPGVGHAKNAMEQLKTRGLDKLIPELKQNVLGICLGMQLMCNKTEEGGVDGLGVFDTEVKRFKGILKTPQIGWNQVESTESPLFNGLPTEAYMYFVHSYYVPKCKDAIGFTDYESVFSSALNKDNFYACQFHPEKSGKDGELILKNFLKICE